MASDDSSLVAMSANAERGVVDRFEDRVLSRRSFLVGLGTGGIAGAGGAVALTREETGFQALATLAAAESAPGSSRYFLPAVDATGSGLIVTVAVDFADGSGGLYVDLDGVEVRHDLQLALREAVAMASQLAGRTLSGTDVRVSFETGRTSVVALRGKSWEAGLVVAVVAGLRRAALARETLVTGVVAPDGELLPVGSIPTKARTARAFGASELIVPSGTPVGEGVAGIDVVEVGTIGAVVDRVLG